VDPIDNMLGRLTKVLREPSSRKETVKEFERCYGGISMAARRSLRREVLDILDELSCELAYYVSDPAMRAQDPSYYGDERLVKEVESTLPLLSRIGLAVTQGGR
jgi:hypothetical protein